MQKGERHSRRGGSRNHSQAAPHSATLRRAPKTVVYSPESAIRRPRQLFKAMGQDLVAAQELAWQLMLRDISAKYRQSFLGIFWAFIPPVILAFGFVLAKNSGVVNISTTDLPYPAYIMFSMTLWQTFVEAINGPVQAVGAAKAMLSKINFPYEALILAKLGEVFFNFGIKLLLIIGLFVWFRIPLHWSVAIAPVALIHLIILGTFLGLLIAPIGAIYQDISMGLTLVTGMWLFITPVVYPVPSSGIFGSIVKLNPVTPLLVTTRELAIGSTLSDPQGFWIASLIGIVGLLIAWIIYRLGMPFVIERISS
jgi:lipopolysaccharide transport system permease protein